MIKIQTFLSILFSCLAVVLAVCPPALALSSDSNPSGDIGQAVPSGSVCNANLGGGVGNSSACTGAKNGQTPTGDPFFGPNSLLRRVVETILFLVGTASVVMVIVGGFRYVVSGGDSSSTKSAKDTILYAVVGLVITLLAQIIVTVVTTLKIL